MTGINAVPKHSDMRQALIDEITAYQPDNGLERAYIPRFLKLLKQERHCFYRDCFPAHITGSALLLDETGEKILMNYHASLDRWLNFGGHADGDDDILHVAIRETMEESGLTAFTPVSADIFDIDIHEIPENPSKGEPAHDHFDIRYIMQMTGQQQPVLSAESVALQWMTFDEALQVIEENDSLRRVIAKLGHA